MDRHLTIVIAATLLIAGNSVFAQQRNTSTSRKSSVTTYSEDIAGGASDSESNKTFVQESTRKPIFASPAKPRVVIRTPDRSPVDTIPSNFEYRSLAPPTLKQPKPKTGVVIRHPAKSPADFSQTTFEDRRLAPATRNNPEPKTRVVVGRPARSSANSRHRRSVVFAQTPLQPKPQREQIKAQNRVTRVSPPKKPATPNALVKQKPSIDPLKTEVTKTTTQTTFIDYKVEIAPLTVSVTKALTTSPKVKKRPNVLDAVSASVRAQSQTTRRLSPMKSTRPILRKEPVVFAATQEVEAQDSNEKPEPLGSLGDDSAAQGQSKANRTEDAVVSVAATDLAPQVETSGTSNAAVEASIAEASSNESSATSLSRRTNRQVKSADQQGSFLLLLIVPVLACLGWIIFVAQREFQDGDDSIQTRASAKKAITYRRFREAATARPLTTGLSSRDTKATDTSISSATTNTTNASTVATPAATTASVAENTSVSATTEPKTTLTYRQWQESVSGNITGLPTSATSNSTRRTSDNNSRAANNLEEQRPEQARRKQYEATAPSAGSSSSKPDDLTKISGIGSATQKALGEKGIHRFEQLANLSLQQLDDLLADMGRRFVLQNTSTWSAQAQSFVSQRSSDEDADLGVLEDINSIRAIGSGSDSTSRSTSDVRIESDKS